MSIIWHNGDLNSLLPVIVTLRGSFELAQVMPIVSLNLLVRCKLHVMNQFHVIYQLVSVNIAITKDERLSSAYGK